MNLGAALNQQGETILLVDLDPQASLTYYVLGRDSEDVEASVFDLLMRDSTLGEVLIEIIPGLDLIPSDFSLVGLESLKARDRALLLKDLLRGIKGYDFILIDTPPAINLFTIMAVVASSSVYVVVNADMFSYRAMIAIEDLVSSLEVKIRKQIVVNMFDSRRNIEKTVLEDLKRRYGDQLFRSTIRRSVAIPEGILFGQDVFRHKKSLSVIEDFEALGKEVIKREEV